MDKLQIQYRKTEELIPYVKNPRKNKDAVAYVMNSIEQFGFKNPIIIDKNNEIIAGHTRLMAAKKLGMEEVPCIMADDLTEDQIRAFRIIDNKTSEYAQWDMGLLGEELQAIEGIDMEMYGFDLNMDEETKEKDEKPEVEFTEVLGEEHNYIVLYFDNEVDWLQILSILDIEEVKNLSTRIDGMVRDNMERRGIGRVIKGNVALEKLRKHYENQH